MRNLILTLAVSLVGIVIVACEEAVTHAPTEVVAVQIDGLPNDSESATWQEAPVFTAELLVQDVVDPRLFEPSTTEVNVQAVTSGGDLAVRMVWTDESDNNLPGAARFTDACAIQLPQVIGPGVPDPQMGEADHPVEITFWRASWQAVIDGRGDTIQELYPNASIDHYPFEAASFEPGSDAQREAELRYAPARALGNDMEGPRDRPVQDLVAVGPGTLSPAESPQSDGNGRRTDDGWEVVITRPLPAGLEPGGSSVIAFAIWDGAEDEVGSRKMRSAWVPLSVE